MESYLTHGAVSRQIKTLEDHLGVRLFRRMTRRFELTDVGLSFLVPSPVCSPNWRVRPATFAARARTSPGRQYGVSFASKRPKPRLHRLMARYPDFDVQLDVAVCYGAGRYLCAATERMMNETITPVCTPAFRDRTGGLRSPHELAFCQLVHEIGMTATWEHWFAMMGVSAVRIRGPGYSHGSMSVEGRSAVKG